MNNDKRTIRRLKRELVANEIFTMKRKTETDDTYNDVTLHRLAAQRNTIEWVLRMLEEGNSDG